MMKANVAFFGIYYTEEAESSSFNQLFSPDELLKYRVPYVSYFGNPTHTSIYIEFLEDSSA